MKTMNYYELTTVVMFTIGCIAFLVDAESWSAILLSKVVGIILISMSVFMYKTWCRTGKVRSLKDIEE